MKLAKKTQLPLNEDLILFLDEVTDFNLEVRYPEYKSEDFIPKNPFVREILKNGVTVV